MAWSVHVINRPTLALDTGAIAVAGYITLDDITTGDLGALDTAVPEAFTFKRLGIGHANVEFHVTDPLAIAQFVVGNGSDHTKTRELWFVEDDVVRFMGVPGPWQASLQSQTVSMRLLEPTTYLKGKVFGRADRINQIDNGGFEDATIAPWTAQGTGTFTVDATFANEDDQSLKIVAAANDVAYASQVLTSTVDHSYAPGLVLTLAAWCYIDPAATVPTGTTLASLVATASGVPTISEVYQTDSSFLLDQWQRIEVQLLLSAFTDWTVEVRLVGVQGTIWWDSVQTVYPDSTTMLLGDDIGVLIGNVVEYSQTPSEPVGQSSELIGHDVGSLGIVPSAPRGFAHNLHENIWNDGLMQLADEFQIDIWLGPDRLIHADTHRGSLRNDLAVSIAYIYIDDTYDDVYDDQYPGTEATIVVTGAEVPATEVSGDPTQEASSVIVMGEGRSFAREEVGRVDTSGFGGLVKTIVEQAPPSTTVAAMGNLADSLLAKLRTPAALPSVTYKIPDPADRPEPGDTVPLVIDFGCVQFDDTLRVEAVTVDPRTMAVTVTFDVDWAA